MALDNTAVLPSGPRIDKNTEITPEPETLARHAYVLTVKPLSRVVLVMTRTGQVLARYFDEEFAKEEIAGAGLKWDELLAPARLKQEEAERAAARRKYNRPDRRLRSERKRGRPGKGDATPPES